MSERSEILRRIRESAQQSGEISASLGSLRVWTTDAVRPILTDYIRERFLLEAEDVRSDNIMELSEAGLRRYIELFRAGKITKEKARQCSTASSVIVKKVLLMKAIQDDFGIRLTPARSAEITTITELVEEVVRQRGDTKCSES